MSADYDDRITVKSHADSHDIFEVVFHTYELKSDRKFLASFSGVLTYVEDVLISMRRDIDPFEEIQLSTDIHPTLLYKVPDIDDNRVVDLMMSIIRDALRFDTRIVRR